ncbi:hypothetical protein [Micromonospora sp. URMC 103]|uniref:hypothetical protein n=1 Tax=Micromonospora sp. URMC 103 TaxID=3423406 RepID=UPI003F1CA4A3
MPPHPARPASLAWQVFRGSCAVRQGLLTRHQLRGASWVRLLHDVYADARLDRDHRLTCEAALLRLPPGATIAGPSAAYLHGVEHAASFTNDVHVLVPKAARVDSHRGIRVHVADMSGSLAPAVADLSAGRASKVLDTGRDRCEGAPPLAPAHPAGPVVGPRSARRIPRSDPTTTAWETAVWLEPVRAVGIVDALLGRGLVDAGALTEIADRRIERPGGRRARWVFDLADPAAQSPPESHLRVRLVLAGLPRPVARHPVRLPTGLVLHPDLAWPRYRVAVEYDGVWHADADQLQRDRRRLNQLVGEGWLVLHVTGRRLQQDFPGIVREVSAALYARGWRSRPGRQTGVRLAS